MTRSIAQLFATALLVASHGLGQGFEAEPVFRVHLIPDREPAVAGEALNIVVELAIDRGWHINSDAPGDDFSLPTEIEFELPDGWYQPIVSFPDGEHLDFEFADQPIEVWEGRALILANLEIPENALGDLRIRAAVTAQACNNTQCLPPETVRVGLDVSVAPPGTSAQKVNESVFAAAASVSPSDTTSDGPDFAATSFPFLIIGVFLAGLALNLTPCVFPLIPITIGFFTQQTKNREGSTFPLALAYVLGIASTYSALGVLAALTGALFGSALQSPWVVGLIVVVLLSLATSMFGLWELRVPTWAQRASGGRTGIFGALIMGLVMGFVAAPCIGPFVVGLLTYVGQRGDPIFGFVLFFTLALGLGLPYLILGTFTGAVNRLPASGMWMVGVRRVFGVLLITMAAYFAAPLMPNESGTWLMAGVLVAGGLYLLIIDRTGHEQPTIDRVMRSACVAMIVAGLITAPSIGHEESTRSGADATHLSWEKYDDGAVRAAHEGGRPVIIDFFADWCAPCKELDEKTFAAPEVREILVQYARFKVDVTRSNASNRALTEAYGVAGVPTVIVYREGVERFRITGFEPPQRFLDRLVE